MTVLLNLIKHTSLIILIIISILACNTHSNNVSPQLKNESDSISYYLGLYTGSILKEANYKSFNKTLFKDGIRNASRIDNTNNHAFNVADSIIDYYIIKARQKENEFVLEEGRKFLNKNAKRKGIFITPSGLQYEILRQGNGIKPKINDSIVTFFRGTTLDGKEFYNTYDGTPPDTSLFKYATPGGLEAVQLMPTGSHYRFWVPAELAYGLNPIPGGIVKPNMTLVYEIELFAVMPSKPTK